MATCHGGTGNPIARDDLHMEDPEITGMDNDLDATIALGGLEAEDNSNEHLPNNQAKLMALMKEINDVCQ